jgi:iron complex outermembrane recepter protein
MRITLAVAVACLGLGAISVATQAEAAFKQPTNIPAQGLDTALQAFARDRNLQLVYASDEVNSLRTSGAFGELTADQALTQLLSGTGLTYRYLDAQTITVYPRKILSTSDERGGAGKGEVSSPGMTENQGGDQDKGFWDRFRVARADQGISSSSSRAGFFSANPSGAAGGTSSDSSSDTSSSEQTKLDEIVVTAQKVSEKLMKVPESISVLTGEQLDQLHVVRMSDWSALAPGLNINDDSTPGKGALVLEGIPSLGAASEVGVYVDDTAIGSSSTFGSGGATFLDLMPYDLDRIEVLRGPQGTLYGASSMGGLVKYVAKAPNVNNSSFNVGGDFFGIKGSDGHGDGIRGAINLPIVSGQLGLRASAYDEYTPGFITNGLTRARDQNGIRQTGGRAALLWDINSDISIQISGLYQKVAADNETEVALSQATGQPIYGAFTEDNVRPEPSAQRLRLYDLTLNWDLHWAQLTSVSSYQNFQDDLSGDATADFAPYNVLLGLLHLPGFAQASLQVNVGLEKFTQEIRLASPQNQRLKWLVGGFFTHEKSTNDDTFDVYDSGGAPISLLNPFVSAKLDSTYKEYAAFGDLTWQVTDRLDLTGGVRYAHNSQFFQSQTGGFLENLGGPLPPSSGKSSESVPTFLFSPNYHLNDTTIAYVRIATGYQPGGANVVSALFPTVPSTFSSSRLIDYQPGLKSTFLDGRVSVDVSAFFIEWTKIQLLVEGPSGTNAEENGGKARSRGFDLTGSYTLIPGLVLGTNLNYTDAILTTPVASLNTVAGARLPYIPRWSGALTAEYTTPLLGANWRAFAGGGYHYIGSRPSNVEGATVSPTLLLPADATARSYNTLDLHLGATRRGLRVSLYAKNLTDKHAYLAPTFYRYSVEPFNTPIDLQAPVLQPRTIGISVDQTF